MGGRIKRMIRLLQILLFFFYVFQGVHNENILVLSSENKSNHPKSAAATQKHIYTISLLLSCLGWALKILTCLFNRGSSRQHLHGNQHPSSTVQMSHSYVALQPSLPLSWLNLCLITCCSLRPGVGNSDVYLPKSTVMTKSFFSSFTFFFFSFLKCRRESLCLSAAGRRADGVVSG